MSWARQLAAVDGQQVIARRDVDPRLGQRRAQVGIPVLAVVDPGETVAPVFDRVIRAQQAGRHAVHFGQVAAADSQVADLDPAQHLGEKIVQVAAGDDVPEERLVAFLGRRQVVAVALGVVEELALDAPDLVEHLPPLRPRVDPDLDGVGRQGRARRRGRRRRAGRRHGPQGADEPAVALVVEVLLAVGGQDEGPRAGDDHVGPAGLEIVAMDGRAGSGRGDRRVIPRLESQDGVRLPGNQGGVIPVRDGQGQDALEDVVEIDLDGGRFGLRGLSGLAGFGRSGLVRGGFIDRRLFGSFLLFRPLLLVALRSQGRRVVLGQDDEIDGS